MMRMAGVIRLVIIIILAVFASLSVLLLLLMSARTGIEVVGANGEASVDLRYGVLRIPIYPRRKEKAEPKPVKDKKPKKTKKPAKYKRVFNKDELDIGEVLGIVMDILEGLGGTFNISRLRVRVLIGTDDAAKTGMLLGCASAVIGIAVPFFENTFVMKDYHINVDADFEAGHTEWAFDMFLYVRPIRIISVMLRHSPKLFRLYKRLFKKVEAETNE